MEYLTIHITASDGRVWGYNRTARLAICEHLVEKELLEVEYKNEDGVMFNVTDLGFVKIEEYQKEYL